MFSWSGGAYIDVAPAEGASAADVVNVYDYAAGRPTIGTLAEFEAWIAEAQ